MDGMAFLKSLPEDDYIERERLLIAAIKQGNYMPPAWFPIERSWNNKRATLFVASDALMIGTENGVRIALSARASQAVADALGCFLPTTEIADLIYRHAQVRISPQTQGPPKYDYVHMHRTTRMIDHHLAIEKARAGRCGLIDNVGKHWVLTNSYARHPTKAANYGWHDKAAPFVSASGLHVLQPLSFAHDVAHVDYSQTLRLVRPVVFVDGTEVALTAAGANPDTWGIVSSEGPLKFWRIPAAVTPQSERIGADTDPALPAQLAIGGYMESDYVRRDKRLLQRGDYNDDVAMWQLFVGIKADRAFDTQTQEHTRAWQKSHGLKDDGVVGPATLAKANEVLAERSAGPEPVSIIDDFVQAKYFTKAARKVGDVKWIVIHTAEIAEKGTSAEAIARYFQTTSRAASAHFTVDADSIVQSVREKDVAWHAPGANGAGIGVEHAGYARQTREEWMDRYSVDMLTLSAKLVAKLCREWDIPAKYVDREGLLRGERGITTHSEVSQAFKKSTHYDPGPAFPMDAYIDMVRAELALIE
jgi:N-acetyl-anhydromuramyl-L-alanine amidase AmpD